MERKINIGIKDVIVHMIDKISVNLIKKRKLEVTIRAAVLESYIGQPYATFQRILD